MHRLTTTFLALCLTCALTTQALAAKHAHHAPAKHAAAKPAPKKPVDLPEPGLDASLATTARAMPVVTLDGSPLDTTASHLLLMDFNTGSVLAAKAPDAKMYPSSMTKMMTLYLVFGHLKDGTLKTTSTFPVSEKAWRMQGSKMFVPLGAQVDVEDLIRGIAIQSGNDACIVIAEGLAGSEDAFAKQMNDAAAKLLMTHTHFTSASGWPSPDNYTTPRDLAILADALIRDYPQYYHYFSERDFTYNNIHQFNRDTLLGDEALGVDGLKTGHTDAAGYGITLSAKDATGRRLILVLNGLETEGDRAQEGERLLTWGQRNFRDVSLFTPGQPVVQDKVWLGKAATVALTVPHAVSISIPVSGNAASTLKATATYKTPLTAPVTAGTEVGTLAVTLPSGATTDVPLVTATDVARKGAFGRVLPIWRHWLGL